MVNKKFEISIKKTRAGVNVIVDRPTFSYRLV